MDGLDRYNGPKRWGQRPKAVLACTLLLGCLLLCYANSFQGGWQYDDFDNIIRNPKVHMTEISWSGLVKAWNAGLDFQTISRPLAYISFALNYRIGETNVFGYHVVNFFIHWLAAVFLFLFVKETLGLPVFKGRYQKTAVWVAWLSALVWALHPIHVTAVTYIVQRMASLAGLWYILAMYCYLKARQTTSPKVSGAAFALCALCALCALLTKENAVMLAFSLLLYDIILLQGLRTQSLRRGLFIAAGIAIGIGLIGLLYTDPRTLLEPYANRPFTMLERLLSQPRVMFLYLSLLAMPMTSRMTIIHDVEISYSLLDPLTTMPALGGLLGLVILLTAMCKRFPLISYCGLFFLINHAVEGSIFNLEMAYEHRNYIPSMLMFVPLAAAASASTAYFCYRRVFQVGIWVTVACIIISFGFTTYSYNRIFRSELALWHHAVQRAPRLSLTHNNLGNVYWSIGLREQAQQEFTTAFELDRYFNTPHKALVYHNLGLHAAYQERDYRQALSYFESAKQLFEGNHKIWFQTARMQVAVGEFQAASHGLAQALHYWPEDADFHGLEGLIHIKTGNCAAAIQSARLALESESDHLDALSVLAQGHRCQGNREMAIKNWRRILKLEPTYLLGILALIELYDIEGDTAQLDAHVRQLRSIGKTRTSDQVLELAVRLAALSPYEPDHARIKIALTSTDVN